MFSILFPTACSAEYKAIKSECNQRGEKINTCNFMKVMLNETGHCSSDMRLREFLPQVNKRKHFMLGKLIFFRLTESQSFLVIPLSC